MMKVAIATSSAQKIAGIKEAMCRFFDTEIEFVSKSSESGVPNQPFGEETYIGAFNRIQSIRLELPNMDFYVSCEAGIEKAFSQYFNVQVVCIYESKSKNLLWGKSSGWMIPSEDIETIKKETLDKYLIGKGINTIEDLLGTNNSRRAAVAQATELALASKKLQRLEND